MVFVHGNVTYDVMQADFSSNDTHSIAVISFTTQYHINISIKLLQDTLYYASYARLLSQMKQEADSAYLHYPVESTNALIHIVCNKCKDIFENSTRLCSTTSLQDYIQPITHRITLVKDEQSHDGVAAESSSDATKSFRWGMASVNLHALDERAAALRKLDARQLWVSHDIQDQKAKNMVRTLDGQTLFFKACYDPTSPEIARELSVLLDITDHQLHSTLRLSRLAGLVFLEDGSVAGLVLEWLSALPLADARILSNSGFHRIWENQVKTIVSELHQRNIIWGDVNPHNILVDAACTAWVVDFGGNHNVEFIDEGVKETMTGDDQGVRYLFEEWLPQKLAASGAGPPTLL